MALQADAHRLMVLRLLYAYYITVLTVIGRTQKRVTLSVHFMLHQITINAHLPTHDFPLCPRGTTEWVGKHVKMAKRCVTRYMTEGTAVCFSAIGSLFM